MGWGTAEGRANWDAATHALDRAMTLSRAMPSPYSEAKALYTYGMLHARKGEYHLAIERLRAALAIFGRLGERPYTAHAERQLMSLTTR